jgi:nickel-dependent lactate racemase
VQSILHYGMEFSEGTLLAHCGQPAATPIADIPGAIRQVMSEPMDYPEFRRSTTPGDRVVVAIDEGLPRAGQIAAAVIHEVIAAGVAPDGITLLRTAAEARLGIADPASLPADLRQRITFATHDAANRREMAYLAASKSGEAILLNRAIVDADVVLPIGCVHRRWMAGYHGVHSPVFPTFSDAATQARFLATDTRRPGKARKELLKEVENVGWLLGVTFTIQVVPGAGDEVLHLLAGSVDAVRHRARELYEEAWRCVVPRRADLVVTSIEGGPDQQTWENVGRALAVAERLVEDGGSIAVCSDLAEAPGPAVSRLADAPSSGEALRQIRREHQADALPAAQLARSLGRAKVYLLSKLDETLFEDLEIAPISDPGDVARLARRAKSCIVVSNAPYAVVSANGE